MATAPRTFRVFVSSTFSDLRAEREALQRHVWPALARLCARHGARFQAIDLRWGVSAEAGLDQQTMAICLGEIERCRQVSPKPNFIVLLGDRYGWRPLPATIPASEMAALLRQVSDDWDRAVVMVTHDPRIAAYADRIIFLKDGVVVDETTLEPASGHSAELVAGKVRGLGDWHGG